MTLQPLPGRQGSSQGQFAAEWIDDTDHDRLGARTRYDVVPAGPKGDRLYDTVVPTYDS